MLVTVMQQGTTPVDVEFIGSPDPVGGSVRAEWERTALFPEDTTPEEAWAMREELEAVLHHIAVRSFRYDRDEPYHDGRTALRMRYTLSADLNEWVTVFSQRVLQPS